MIGLLENKHLPGQISRFSVIGILASTLHVAVASGLFYGFGASSLSANFIGFFCAWSLSFAGHYFWTFNRMADMRLAMLRFFLTSVTGLCLNQAIVWLMVEVLKQSFSLAMGVVVVVIPALTFVMSRFWAFRAE